MRFLAGCAVLLAGVLPAQADPLSYDYVYLNHQQVNTDNGRARNNAFGGYYELNDHVQVFGSYGDAGAYGNPSWEDSRALRLGIGGRYRIGEDTLIALQGAVVRARFDQITGETVKDTGYHVTLEARRRIVPWAEVIVSAARSDVLGFQVTEYVLGPVFHLNRHIALGALYRHSDGNSGAEATVRWYY